MKDGSSSYPEPQARSSDASRRKGVARTRAGHRRTFCCVAAVMPLGQHSLQNEYECTQYLGPLAKPRRETPLNLFRTIWMLQFSGACLEPLGGPRDVVGETAYNWAYNSTSLHSRPRTGLVCRSGSKPSYWYIVTSRSHEPPNTDPASPNTRYSTMICRVLVCKMMQD